MASSREPFAPGRLVAEFDFGVTDLPEVRHLASIVAEDAGLPEEKADALSLALNEIATNAIVHGSPPNTLRIWVREEEIVCEVSDEGRGIDDPFAGEERPPAEATNGRGLWLARVLCDAVEIRNGLRCTVSLHAAIGVPVAAAPA
jgi:anti-sigma regulatory factor (Ser/Thr protein kinase)